MSLPITKEQAIKAVTWMKSNFKNEIAVAVNNTPFSIDHICGIACQETAYFWLSFINKKSPAEILARCVLDASGDFPDTVRTAFPKNTAAFKLKYPDAFTNMLISEANITRKMRGFGPQQWVYKGYGIFQYDLQYVIKDRAFFEERQWYTFSNCLAKVMMELTTKWAIYKSQENALWKTIKAYNGSGPNATNYANNVIQYTAYSKEVVV
jgi:hypothetical protein